MKRQCFAVQVTLPSNGFEYSPDTAGWLKRFTERSSRRVGNRVDCTEPEPRDRLQAISAWPGRAASQSGPFRKNSTAEQTSRKRHKQTGLTYAFSSLCALTVPGGCTAGDIYLLNNPGTSPRVAHDIRRHAVGKGMTKPEVLASIEEPYDKREWKLDPDDETQVIVSSSLSSIAPYRQAWVYRRYI